MKWATASILGLLVTACAVFALQTDTPVPKIPAPILTIEGGAEIPDLSFITPEGYIVYLTSDMAKIRAMCQATMNQPIPHGAVVFGCALWRFESNLKDKHDPKGPCMAIALYGNTPDGSNNLVHELRHCREGFFHSKRG